MSFKLILIALLLWQSNCFAQKPDYAAIEKEVNKPRSEFYYPKLFDRYKKCDTTLSMDEYRMLYYGAFFRDNMQGAGVSGINKKLNEILDKEKVTEADNNEIVKLCLEHLAAQPFDLRVMNKLGGAYKRLGKNDLTEGYVDKIKKIILTINSTGDGLTAETAFHVLEVGHEYVMLEALGFKYGGKQSLRGEADYLTVQPNADKVEGVYFDVSQMFNGYKKIFGDKK